MDKAIEQIRNRLFELADPVYRDFQSSLIPNSDRDIFIGVRTPVLRAYAKELYGTEEASAFLKDLPHRYFDENQLHDFLLGKEKPFPESLQLCKLIHILRGIQALTGQHLADAQPL